MNLWICSRLTRISLTTLATVARAEFTRTCYFTDVDRDRQLMLQNSDYYSELVSYANPEGFAPVNAVLICTP